MTNIHARTLSGCLTNDQTGLAIQYCSRGQSCASDKVCVFLAKHLAIWAVLIAKLMLGVHSLRERGRENKHLLMSVSADGRAPAR